jgi:threonine dehydrogenase-like Zn-dependent dehydrogenase
MRELTFVRHDRLEWRDGPDPVLLEETDALVRPFLAGRCDGDTLPLHRPVSRAMQLGLKTGLIDPVVASMVGPVPFRGPFAIGHECVAEVTAVGRAVTGVDVGDVVVVPWSVSCGRCVECRRGVTAKCSTMLGRSPGGALAAFGFGDPAGGWGGMVADSLRIPYADHMLVRVPENVDPLRVAAASDNLTDAWRAVVPPLRTRPGGVVLVIGGAAQSIGLYAAGLAVAHGARARRVSRGRRGSVLSTVTERYDVTVEASSRAQGLRDALRALRPGGVCTGTGYYLAPRTRLPAMGMYATSATLELGLSSVRPHLPEVLEFVAAHDFPAEKVTTLLADWEDAPHVYAARTTKLVLRRPPLDLQRHSGPAPDNSAQDRDESSDRPPAPPPHRTETR